MQKADIIRDVMEILKNKFNVEVEKIEHISLLDPAIGMLPRDSFTLFFDLQEKYDIKFVENDVLDKRFDYFDELIEIVYQKIIEKSA